LRVRRILPYLGVFQFADYLFEPVLVTCIVKGTP
jgi:hypothetical protein